MANPSVFKLHQAGFEPKTTASRAHTLTTGLPRPIQSLNDVFFSQFKDKQCIEKDLRIKFLINLKIFNIDLYNIDVIFYKFYLNF